MTRSEALNLLNKLDCMAKLEQNSDFYVKQKDVEKLINKIYNHICSCKYCKHSEQMNKKKWCKLYQQSHNENWYCADFEKKEEI